MAGRPPSHRWNIDNIPGIVAGVYVVQTVTQWLYNGNVYNTAVFEKHWWGLERVSVRPGGSRDYAVVRLRQPETRQKKNHYVHRLTCFLEYKASMPHGTKPYNRHHEAHHTDHQIEDNRWQNLEWLTWAEHRRRHR